MNMHVNAVAQASAAISDSTKAVPIEQVDCYYLEALVEECSRYTGHQVTKLTFPAGRDRSSFRAILNDGNSVVITRRESQHRALLEERVLTSLSECGAPVPRVIGFNGLVLVQEDMGGIRLAQALSENIMNRNQLLVKGLEELLVVHTSARKCNLAAQVPQLGIDPAWVRALIDRPAVLGSYFDIEAPVPDLDGIHALLSVTRPEFVKWDARPANAVMNSHGNLGWIDWEHCGARNALDDLVWLLCDETVPTDHGADRKLIEEYASKFAPGWSAKKSFHYAHVMGTLHFCVRLGLILSKAERSGWQDRESCADRDKVGASKEQAITLCERAAVWADQAPFTSALAPWFVDIGNAIHEMD